MTTLRPASCAAAMAISSSSKAVWVSTMIPSAPASTRALACSRNARSTSGAGDLAVGLHEAAEGSDVAEHVAPARPRTPRARSATAARLMAAMRSPSPCRFSMMREAPKVFVSRQSEPGLDVARAGWRGRARGGPGSRPRRSRPDSSPACWSCVPMAPSLSRTRALQGFEQRRLRHRVSSGTATDGPSSNGARRNAAAAYEVASRAAEVLGGRRDAPAGDAEHGQQRVLRVQRARGQELDRPSRTGSPSSGPPAPVSRPITPMLIGEVPVAAAGREVGEQRLARGLRGAAERDARPRTRAARSPPPRSDRGSKPRRADPSAQWRFTSRPPSRPALAASATRAWASPAASRSPRTALRSSVPSRAHPAGSTAPIASTPRGHEGSAVLRVPGARAVRARRAGRPRALVPRQAEQAQQLALGDGPRSRAAGARSRGRDHAAPPKGANWQPSTKKSKKCGCVSRRTCSTRLTRRLELAPARPRQQRDRRAFQRGVADLDDALVAQVGHEADAAGGVDVEVAREAAGQVEAIDPVQRHAVGRGQDAQARGVGALGLRQLVDVGFGQAERRAASTTKRRRRRRAVPARSCVRCAAAPDSRSTRPEPQRPHGRAAADHRGALTCPSSSRRTRSIAPSSAGMPQVTPPPSNAGPAGHDAASSRWRLPTKASVLVPMSRSAPTSSPSARPVASRQAAASAPTWLADERQAVDARLGMDGSRRRRRGRAQAGGRGPAVVERRLGRRAVGHHADRGHVQAEEEVAHGGVAGHHQLVDRRGVHGQGA